MVLPLLSLTLTLAAASLPGGPATVLIAPGVHMPRLNLGTCCGSDPTVGVKAWFAAGGTGIDTAWDYKDQPAIAAQLRASGKKRGAYFLTTKVPAGIGALEGNRTDCDNSGNLTQLALDYVRANVLQLGVDQVDLVRGVPRPLASTRRLPLLIWKRTGLHHRFPSFASRLLSWHPRLPSLTTVHASHSSSSPLLLSCPSLALP